ncbi:helix-hairpin-helix domain-containing protein (plasmid) [Deinococcus metallilatus]|uniref:Competence ComEA-like helix-hairpin-helix protein n=1 Tax=Deinococcus metallilatus TaxID=1211322 RepID=A0ABR6MUZ2_9DEIO|nr:helix-hairpin-helix domain-containing protein [Deinococcus metallilatus]MBB5295762.1 competence ComEA-like helix-hairpin-helix protein [Deinococcus metallilatus]QBY06798.1 helix-hairpin-helix domain-containing protein [Deinococcus metallilatus]
MQKRLCLALTAALVLTPAFAQGTSSPTKSTAPTTSAAAKSTGTSSAMNMKGHMGSAATMRAVNVNTATLAQLERIPGMTPKLAQAVIAARASGPFKNEQDFVKRVKGIGAKNVKQFEKYLIFSA